MGGKPPAHQWNIAMFRPMANHTAATSSAATWSSQSKPPNTLRRQPRARYGACPWVRQEQHTCPVKCRRLGVRLPKRHQKWLRHWLSCTQQQVLAWMITISRKRNLNPLENCLKYVHKLSSNTCSWHELVQLTFYGQVNKLVRPVIKWTGACDRSLARLISHIFITQTISDNAVMWETRHSIADWVCFKTQTLQEILSSGERNLTCFRKPNIRSHSLDVHDTKASIPQFYRIRDHFDKCWFENGRATCS